MNEVNKVIDLYNVCVGAVVSLLSALFGAYWYLFASYLLTNVFDWLTGWYKSRKLQKESSKVGLKGIIKKLGYWVIIAVAFLVSGVFVQMGNDLLHIDLSFLTLIGWFTLACLLVNEVRSILENLIECGYNVPAILVKGLAVTEKLLNEKIEEEQ
ncbi:MAG: phage holin family protein [Lachnospiraceae bacterium]|nr:phage holin family protein [Lachnospiraceae bacterium]